MRATLALLALALAVSTATAQVRPDSAAQDTTGGARTPSRDVQVSLPTGGGVFYYRAGSRLRRASPRTPRALPTPIAPVPDSVASAAPAPVQTLGERERARPQETPLAREGLTQRDLDRLESRLLDALDRRLAQQDRRADSPRVVRQLPAEPGREAAPATSALAPERQIRPGTPRDTSRVAQPYRAQPILPLEAADRVVTEQVERAILDTGLFRAAAVHFEEARAGLLPVSEQTLRAIAAVLVRYPGLQIEVGGHTDAVGSEASNRRLSQERAESAVDFLVAAGVARDRLAAVGYGERRPVASDATETGRALNRRVEFVVLNR